MCIPPDKLRNRSVEPSVAQEPNKDNVIADKTANKKESKSNNELDSNENIKGSVEQVVVDSDSDLSKKMNGVSVSDKDNVSMETNTENSDNVQGSNIAESALEQLDNQNNAGGDKETESKKGSSSDNGLDTKSNEKIDNNNTLVEEDGVSSGEKAKRLSDSKLEKEVLNAAELQELHEKADILHFLLPALCHLTAEEDPRHILLQCGGLGVLDLYMWCQWERLEEQENLRETLVLFFSFLSPFPPQVQL